jgi:hypothetical protein
VKTVSAHGGVEGDEARVAEGLQVLLERLAAKAEKVGELLAASGALLKSVEDPQAGLVPTSA